MKKTTTAVPSLSDDARDSRRKYYKQYYRNHRDDYRRNNAEYWKKRSGREAKKLDPIVFVGCLKFGEDNAIPTEELQTCLHCTYDDLFEAYQFLTEKSIPIQYTGRSYYIESTLELSKLFAMLAEGV